jgi:hypothetical protein
MHLYVYTTPEWFENVTLNTNGVTFLYRLQTKYLGSHNSKVQCFSFKLISSIWNIFVLHECKFNGWFEIQHHS